MGHHSALLAFQVPTDLLKAETLDSDKTRLGQRRSHYQRRYADEALSQTEHQFTEEGTILSQRSDATMVVRQSFFHHVDGAGAWHRLFTAG